MSETTVATLIIEASERDSDLLWVSGFRAGDPFVFVEIGGRTHLLLTNLELGRGRKESRVDEVHSWTEAAAAAADALGRPARYGEVVAHFLRGHEIAEVRVPARFPLRIADELREAGISVTSAADPFYPGRGRKSAEEISQLEEAQRVTEEAMLFAIDRIRQSEVRGGELHLEGEPLDVDRLKQMVRIFCLEREMALGEFIVAPGDQGCDPHDCGSGSLRAGETIIIDIFPRHLTTMMWGDMTRTVFKGEAPAEVRRLHAAVQEAQEAAIAAIAPGVTGDAVHAAVEEVFARESFPTELRDGDWVGFFHGTGHGVGLDIHELPRLMKGGPELEEGMVVTVEPGLYYPGLGGCRIEDIVVVTADGCRNLNRAPKSLEV